MPRKPQPPMDLVIEGLSDGREIRPKSFIDDFTGEVMPVKQDERKPRVMRSPWDIREAEQRDRQAKAQALVDRLLPKAEAKPPRVKGMRPVAKLGDGEVIMAPMPPWRRV